MDGGWCTVPRRPRCLCVQQRVFSYNRPRTYPNRDSGERGSSCLSMLHLSCNTRERLELYCTLPAQRALIRIVRASISPPLGKANTQNGGKWEGVHLPNLFLVRSPHHHQHSTSAAPIIPNT